ncbi:MAG: hypothetical protein KKE46_05945 [Gammaproteobacteria bacterium]|nr:hypothetical protein [Gammaproteobacteria bacterium]
MFEPLKQDQNIFATVQFPGTGNAGISYFEGQEVVIAISPEMDLYQLPAFLDAILDGVTRGKPVKVKILVAGSFLNLNSQHTKDWLKECLKDWNGTYENSDFQNILDKGHEEIGEKWTQQLNSILRRYAFNKNVEIVHTRSLEKEEKYWKETFPHVIELCKEEECLEALNKTAFGFAFREFPRLFDQAVSKQGEDEQDEEAIGEISSLRKKIAESGKTEAESKEDREKLIQLMGSFLEKTIPDFNAEALKNNMKLTGMMEGGFYWDYLESADTFIYPGKEMPIFSELRKKKEAETLDKEKGSHKWGELKAAQFLRKKIASWIPVRYQRATTLKELRQAKQGGQNGVGSKFRDSQGHPCKPDGAQSPDSGSDSDSDNSTNECTITVNGLGDWEGTFLQCKSLIATLNQRKDYSHALSALVSLRANSEDLEETVTELKNNFQTNLTSLVESLTASQFGKDFSLFKNTSLSDNELEELLNEHSLSRKTVRKAARKASR